MFIQLIADMIRIIQERTIQSIDDRVRAICQKYESNIAQIHANDTVNCTLVIIGQIVEHGYYDRTGNEKPDEKLTPSCIAIPFNEIRKGEVRESKGQYSDTNFKAQFWVLIGHQDCYLEYFVIANQPITASGLLSGHFGPMNIKFGPQHQIKTVLRRR